MMFTLQCDIDYDTLVKSFKKDLKTQLPIFLLKMNLTYEEFIKGNFSLAYHWNDQSNPEQMDKLKKLLPEWDPDRIYSLSDWFLCARDSLEDNPSADLLKRIAKGFELTPLFPYTPHAYQMTLRKKLDDGFFFVHFTDSIDRLNKIHEFGFIGATSVLDLGNTGKGLVLGDYAYDAGYIYVYALNAKNKDDALKEFLDSYSSEYVCSSRFAIFGFALKGVLVYHRHDQELQAIAPNTCVDKSSLLKIVDKKVAF